MKAWNHVKQSAKSFVICDYDVQAWEKAKPFLKDTWETIKKAVDSYFQPLRRVFLGKR